MTQQGQLVCFGTERAFANKMETGKVIPFEGTPKGWNFTVELEAPNNANNKLQEVMDIMMTEKRLEQTGKIEHMRGLSQVLKQMLTGRKDVFCTTFTNFSVARHRLARPHERSLEPLTETDGDETVMDNPGDEDAGETSAVKSKIQPMKPSDQEIATHEACGHYPYRDWCRACDGGTGRWDAHTRRHENRTVCLWRAWIMGSSLMETTVGTQGEPLRFWW